MYLTRNENLSVFLEIDSAIAHSLGRFRHPISQYQGGYCSTQFGKCQNLQKKFEKKI